MAPSGALWTCELWAESSELPLACLGELRSFGATNGDGQHHGCLLGRAAIRCWYHDCPQPPRGRDASLKTAICVHRTKPVHFLKKSTKIHDFEWQRDGVRAAVQWPAVFLKCTLEIWSTKHRQDIFLDNSPKNSMTSRSKIPRPPPLYMFCTTSLL